MTAKRYIAGILAAVTGIGVSLILLYGCICSVAFRPQWYIYVQRLYQISEPEMEERDAELAGYLRKDNQLSEAWNAQEILHMQDVLNLFSFGEKLCIIAGCSSVVVLFPLAAWCYRSAWETLRKILLGFIIVWGVFVLCAVWALVDFSQWFTWMHELVFTNDLWLFDTSESLLIRLLPQEFFERTVLEIFLRFAVVTGILSLVSRIGTGKRKK